VLEFLSNDPDGTDSRPDVVVGGEAYEDTPVRFVTSNRTGSPTVHIQIPASISPSNRLWEQLPSGLSPVDPSHGGYWDPASGILQWDDVSGGAVVSYSLTGIPGASPLSGWILVEGHLHATAGDGAALLLTPEDSDGDGLPDWWEHRFFDTRTGALPWMDSDGDGYKNVAAFLGGNHPLTTGFQAQKWAPYVSVRREGSSCWLEVHGFDGADYRVEESMDLVNWSPLTENVLAGQPVPISPTSLPGASSLFYRAVVEEP
jgi:hypothetical protein